MKPLIFLDTETTHLSPLIGEIIEIAIITVFPNNTQLSFCVKIKPKHIETADKTALLINGYNIKSWEDSKPFEDHAEYIAHLLHYGIIIGHNVQFDYSFIKEELKKAGVRKKISYHTFDTKMLAMEHLPIQSTSMKSIRNFFGWSYFQEHTALKDCEDCKRLYYKLIRANFIQRLFWKWKYNRSNK